MEIRLLFSNPQAGGYATHLVGKWHLGFCNKKFLPTRQDERKGCLRWYLTQDRNAIVTIRVRTICRRRGFDTFFGQLQHSTNYRTRWWIHFAYPLHILQISKNIANYQVALISTFLQKLHKVKEHIFLQRKSMCCPENGERDAWIRPLVSHHHCCQWHTNEGCQLCNPSYILLAPQRGALIISAYRDFQSNPIHL